MKDEGFFIKYYEHDKQSIHIFTHKYLILVDQVITMGLKYPDNNRSRAGTIRSAADTIRIRYGPCRYDTYSIRYTCT